MQGSHSLPRNASGASAGHGEYTLPHRPYRPSDGSLSDSNYTDAYYTNSPYGSWLRHSAHGGSASSTAYTASLPTRSNKYEAGMSEADSMESLSSLPAMQQHRASLTHPHPRLQSARLNRSNSIRSTKSEKMYQDMLSSTGLGSSASMSGLPGLQGMSGLQPMPHHHSSQPTSPTAGQLAQGASRFNYPGMSSISSSASSHGISRNSMSPYSGMMKMSNKDDDVHGSSVSLVSTASSLYSTPEEKQAHEIRKLRRELGEAQEKVHTLTSQLSTNAHVVSAFEQSLSNMTSRLHQLTSSSERKDSELIELRQTIELLRKQSVEAGLTSAYIQNMSPNLTRRHTVTDGEGMTMSRQLSTDSVSSLNSLSSACSHSSSAHPACGSPGNKKKKGWLRSSFSKAFSRSKKNKNGSVSDVEDARGMHSDLSAPSSPLLNGGNGTLSSLVNQNTKLSQSSSAIYPGNGTSDDTDCPELVEELRKQLREKDLVLTDIRLEALSSAHQLESLKDTVMKMRNEMLNLKQDNERLQRIVSSKSLTTSQCSLAMEGLERRFSMTDATNANLDSVDFLNNSGGSSTSTMSMAALAALDPDGKRTPVAVLLGAHGSYERYMEETGETLPQMCSVAAIAVSGKTKWEVLDTLIKRLFKEYLSRVDPTTSLGLGTESIASYHVGEVVRYKESPTPELLPCGYLVGNADSITICLRGAVHNGSVDALAFETLIPKSIIQRYISLLTEHRRIILCGPSGTGKSYLANKLAEFLVLRSGKESTVESIATFNVDHKSSKELRQYLANVAEQCENNAADLPSVIILDNLHHAASLGDVFNGFLNAKYNKCPFIIGTMNQATCSTTNLQLHHNFRWILCANHMEPVKGFLGRYLRRKLLESEAKEGSTNSDMARVLDWIPKVWQQLNKFLEAHSSSDVTIGPRLFLPCPTDLAGSQIWFTDLWNYSLVPYLLEAVREGLQLYGRRAPWEDPTVFIVQTYPWTEDAVQGGHEALLKLRAEDVGYDMQPMIAGGSSIRSISSTHSDTDGDPLLNMLMRLQEAANYSSPHSNDSDSASHDSHPSSSHTDSVSSGHARLESSL